MAYKKKYKKGAPIQSLEEIIVLFNTRDFIWVHGKAYHYGWWSSWSVMEFSRKIWRGAIFYVEKTGDDVK